jgi:glycosyltransferase involved in cell wall biosynthesis
MTRGEAAALLARSAIFSAMPQPDSPALTTLEALASGCRVVGYAGLGGADFVGGEGGAWISEGDAVSFCRKLAEACQDSMRGGASAQARLADENARDAAVKRFRHAVGALYTGYMGADPARFLR